jgi:hypothetical protein
MSVLSSEFRVLILLVIALIVFFACACLSSPLPTASTDHVPTENWTYDAFMHLAARGLVPDVPAQRFMGDWLYSREQMASFVVIAADSLSPEVNEEDHTLLYRLAIEFLPELKVMGASSVLKKIGSPNTRSGFVPAVSVEPRLVFSSDDNELTGIYNLTGLGLGGKYVTAGLTLSNRRSKFGSSEFSTLEKYFIHGKTPNWEWEIGTDFLWWGPGYSGSMILDDNSPAFPFILLGKDFYFGRHIGYLKVTQFASRFHDHGKPFWLLGRRWEKRFSKRFHVGISETAKTSKTPNPLAFVLPSFYLYQHIFIDDVDMEWNSFLSFDALYRFSNSFESYFDFLIDDMTAPSFLRDEPAWDIPRKFGLLLGVHWSDLLGDGTTGAWAEYIFTDNGTYGATRTDFPDLAYTHNGLIIGHPVGPNSQALFLRFDRRLWEGWAAAAEYLGRIPKDDNGVNPFNTHQISLLLVRDLTPRSSITLRYDSLKQPESENRFQLGVTYGF